MAVPIVTREVSRTGRLARIYCIEGAPWNPIDHLANLWEQEIVNRRVVLVGEHEGQEVGSFVVDHYPVADVIPAEAQPPTGGDVNVLVFHANVGPARVCQTCGAGV